MIRFISLLVILFSGSVWCNTLLIIGDSLSAGYQMPVEKSWPVRLESELKERGFEYNVINASISGDTTGNGLDRLPDLLREHSPDWVLIELGANDGLRGFHPNLIKKNLNQMILMIQNSDAHPALMQIQTPPNYGKRYSQAFSSVYDTLASSHQVPLLPFFLEQVILKQEWMMGDGLHPNEKAQPWIAAYVADNLSLYLD
ncbi:arylesterase [Vibrio sp. JC009]|uniref:arylesterase n=1 Tax=Vibrio sp. JC009 TaxID=2912314 RepID=UPI0023AEBC0A|nr:arylesterase [Vibrio sp. JC009]WED24390.1 arylesterase [Vibrio sp. JC009]